MSLVCVVLSVALFTVACTGSDNPSAAQNRSSASSSGLSGSSSSAASEDCAVRSEMLGATWTYTGDLVGDFDHAAGCGDIAAIQDAFSQLKWAMADLPDLTDDLINDCGTRYRC